MSTVRIDGNTFVVDKSNDRVGVGTDSPSTAQEVDGTIKATKITVAGFDIETSGDALLFSNDSNLIFRLHANGSVDIAGSLNQTVSL